MNRLIFTLIIVVAVSGSLADIGETAYGNEPYDPGSNPSEGDAIGGLESAIGWGFSTAYDFFSMVIPSLTGIWIIDNWIINPLGIYMIYEGVNWVRGR